MKKRTPVFLISAIIAVIVVMFVFMCLPLNQSKTKAVDGALDLRGQFMGNIVFPLTGQWHFYHGVLLTPADLAAPVFPPSLRTDHDYPAQSCATYRLVVKTDNDGKFMLYLPEIFSAYALWVNGEKLGGEGVVATDKENERLYYSNALIPVNAQNGEIDICLQVSNFSFISNGMYNPMLFGRANEILTNFFRSRMLYMLGIGCILMAAFYHLSLYMFRRNETIYLVFALLCGICFLRFLLEADGFNHLFQILPGNEATFRIYMGLLFSNALAIMLFSFLFFEPDFLKKYRRAVAAYTVGGLVMTAVFPLEADYSKLIYSLLFASALLLTIFRVAMSAKFRQNPLSRLYLIALILPIIVGATSKTFFYNVLYMPGLITNLFLIMSQSLILSQSYAGAFEAVEETNANLEQIVCERTKELQNTNNVMKELIGNISHDLKTPLTVLSVNLEKMSNSPGLLNEAEYQRHARIAFHKNLDLQRLIQNLFEVSRIETGRLSYSPQWVSLKDLFARIQEKYGDFLDSQEIFFDVGFEENAQIWLDPQKIWNVFDNIIYNAVRHTEKGGSIDITAEKKANCVSINIKDTGCGIFPEHLPQIFDPFYKVSSARGDKEGESGVGLYIVKSIVEGLGGSVAAKSEPGKGTCIVVTFKAQ